MVVSLTAIMPDFLLCPAREDISFVFGNAVKKLYYVLPLHITSRNNKPMAAACIATRAIIRRLPYLRLNSPPISIAPMPVNNTPTTQSISKIRRTVPKDIGITLIDTDHSYARFSAKMQG